MAHRTYQLRLTLKAIGDDATEEVIDGVFITDGEQKHFASTPVLRQQKVPRGTKQQPAYMTATQIAKKAGVLPGVVFNAIATKRLPVRAIKSKAGNKNFYYVPEAAAKAWIEERTK